LEEVTFIITSCGRPDLLQETIGSFLNTNRYPIAKYILIEDSADEQMKGFIEERYGDSFNSLIFNAPKLGQIRSIDRAYEEVETTYVFHARTIGGSCTAGSSSNPSPYSRKTGKSSTSGCEG